MSNTIPELLVPAGNLEKMEYALAFGADAVYAGVPKFSLRARENDFRLESIKQALSRVHSLNKKLYLTMNIFPHNRKISPFESMLAEVARLKPDGLIIADPGMIMLARERFPELPLHLSTQSNTINWMTVKFWQELGVKRIILSRELTIDELREIRQRVPDIELEIFIHGAICMAYSGRCLLSNYFNHRDANQGVCSNACRWQYQLYEEPESRQSEDDIYLPLNENYYLQESERPGNLMPVDEDEHGTYIMNARDLSTIEILPEILEAGMDSLKVEGRTKSVYYVSIITRTYRMALDHLKHHKSVPADIRNEVYTIANRGYVTGFLEKNPLHKGQNYESGHSGYQTRRFAGIVDYWEEDKGMAKIRVRNRFERGETLEMITPGGTIPFVVEKLTDVGGNHLQVAHGGGQDVMLGLPEQPDPYTLLRKVIKDAVKVQK